MYESLWDLCVVGIAVAVERRFRLRTGSLFAVYVMAYTFDRFFTEYERIDFAHRIGPLRLNDWTSIIASPGGLVALVAFNRRTPAHPSGFTDGSAGIGSVETAPAERDRATPRSGPEVPGR